MLESVYIPWQLSSGRQLREHYRNDSTPCQCVCTLNYKVGADADLVPGSGSAKRMRGGMAEKSYLGQVGEPMVFSIYQATTIRLSDCQTSW